MNKSVISFFGLLLNCYLINVHASLEDSLAKDGLSQDCNTAGVLLNKGGVNNLQKAFLLNTEFYCYAKNEIKNNKKIVLEKEKEHKKKIIKLVSDAMKSDDNYSRNLLKNIRYHLSLPVNLNELVIKKYTEKTLEFPPFDETGEHPFKPEVFLFKQYEDIASAYFAAGMPEEGERIIQELSKLPHQSEGKVQDLRAEMKVIYPELKPKQSENKKEELPEPEKPDSVTSKPGQKQVINAPEPGKKPMQPANPVAPKSLPVPDSRSNDRTMYYALGVLILLLLIVGVVRKRAIKE